MTARAPAPGRLRRRGLGVLGAVLGAVAVVSLGGAAAPAAAETPAVAPVGQGFWDGGIPDDFGRLLTHLPSGAPSAAMRRLMHRLLLSPGDPMWQSRGRSVQAIRAAKLSELGMVDEIIALAAVETQLLVESAAVTAIIDGLLLARRLAEACDWAARSAAHLEDGYRVRTDLLCLLQAGQTAEALAGAAAVPAALARDHAVFLALVRLAAGDAAAELPDLAWRSLSDPDALLLAVLELSEQPVASGALRLRDPARLMAIARSPTTPPPVRLEAAERAAAAGAMTPQDLLAIYRSVSFTQDEYRNALYIASRGGGPRVRALLMQTADDQADPQDSFDLRRHLLNLALGERAPLAVTLALLEPIQPASRANDIAVEAARAYYVAGLIETAERWQAIARARAIADDRQAVGLASIWPLDWLSEGQAERDERGFGRELRQWLARELDQIGDTGHYNAAVALVTLEALGWPIEPDLWSLLPVDDSRSSVSLPVPSVWWRLEQAAADRSAGMTALFALLVLGERGPADAHPVLLRAVLSALVATGQEDDARRLALEAIWAARS